MWRNPILETVMIIGIHNYCNMYKFQNGKITIAYAKAKKVDNKTRLDINQINLPYLFFDNKATCIHIV